MADDECPVCGRAAPVNVLPIEGLSPFASNRMMALAVIDGLEFHDYIDGAKASELREWCFQHPDTSDLWAELGVEISKYVPGSTPLKAEDLPIDWSLFRGP